MLVHFLATGLQFQINNMIYVSLFERKNLVANNETVSINFVIKFYNFALYLMFHLHGERSYELTVNINYDLLTISISYDSLLSKIFPRLLAVDMKFLALL